MREKAPHPGTSAEARGAGDRTVLGKTYGLQNSAKSDRPQLADAVPQHFDVLHTVLADALGAILESERYAYKTLESERHARTILEREMRALIAALALELGRDADAVMMEMAATVEAALREAEAYPITVDGRGHMRTDRTAADSIDRGFFRQHPEVFERERDGTPAELRTIQEQLPHARVLGGRVLVRQVAPGVLLRALISVKAEGGQS